MLAVLACSGGDVELRVRYGTEQRAARRAQAQQVALASRRYIPAPPVINTVYGPVDPNINGDGQAVAAYTDPTTNTIHLPRDYSPFMRANEVAHLFDRQVLTDGDRNFFRKLMRAPKDGPWDRAYAGDPNGYVSPAEWFSDYYAAAATGLTPQNGYNATQHAEMDERRMRQFEKAMKRLMKRRGLKPYQP
jgi:hypothetical protein